MEMSSVEILRNSASVSDARFRLLDCRGFAAVAADEGGQHGDGDVASQEADRAVGHQCVDAARMERINLPGAVHAPVRIADRTVGGQLLAVGDVDCVRAGEGQAVRRRPAQAGNFRSGPAPTAAVDALGGRCGKRSAARPTLSVESCSTGRPRRTRTSTSPSWKRRRCPVMRSPQAPNRAWRVAGQRRRCRRNPRWKRSGSIPYPGRRPGWCRWGRTGTRGS